jgi:hypothetical protein
MRKKPRIRRPLVAHLAAVRPDLVDPAAAIVAGRVRVNGSIVNNPASLVRTDASIVVVQSTPLRGETKLCAALAAFAVEVADRVALDAADYEIQGVAGVSGREQAAGVALSRSNRGQPA